MQRIVRVRSPLERSLEQPAAGCGITRLHRAEAPHDASEKCGLLVPRWRRDARSQLGRLLGSFGIARVARGVEAVREEVERHAGLCDGKLAGGLEEQGDGVAGPTAVD